MKTALAMLAGLVVLQIPATAEIQVTLQADTAKAFVGRQLTVQLLAQGNGAGLAGFAGSVVATGDPVSQAVRGSFAWSTGFDGLGASGIAAVTGEPGLNGGWAGFGSSQAQLPFADSFAKAASTQIASYAVTLVSPGSVTLTCKPGEVGGWCAAETDGSSQIGTLTGLTLDVTVLVGDVNLDGLVDVADLLYLVATFGLVTGETGYDARCDFNNDGAVDVTDLLMLVENWDH